MESPAIYPESPLDQDDVPYPCKGCGDILEEGKAFELAGNRWHIDCFRCSTCGTLLDSDAHLLLLGDGALICSSCTYSCTSCGNKIEDLAILTGEQAFCKRCFRCRNCKREIDNLRYARTSQGIFCMDCHESLMHRRRKRNRAAAASANKRQQHPGVKLDKSLPSLPPEQAEAHARAAAAAAEDPIADAYADATTEVASRGAAPALDSAKFDNTANVPTPRQTLNEDNLILPSSTYRSSTTTAPRDQSESDAGGEFLIPLAFDPSEEKPSHSHSSSLAPPGHHHGVDPILPESTSPHIAYQEKGRDPNILEPVRYSPEDGEAANTGPLLSSKAYQPQPAQPPPPPQHDRSDSVRSAQSDMPSQIRERSSFSSPSPESTRSSTLPTREGSAVESQRSMTTDTTATLPSRPSHELRKLHENSSVDSSRSLPQSSTMQYPPKRGDSLEAKLQQQQLPRKDYGTSPRPPSVLNPLDDWQGGSNPPPVGQGLSKGSTPKLGDTPRSQRSESYPEPPRHGRQMSHGTVQSDSNRPAVAASVAPADRPGSPSLLRYSLGGDFSMDEDMQRIMAMDDTQILQNESFLRRMSNSVRHGRSFSDKGSRLSRDSKRPRTPVNGFTPSQDPPTPSAGSPEVRADEAAWLRTELRRERQRTLEREQKIAELERALNATADVKLANTELSEKRSTMVNLDAQKEIAIREISVLTDHLEAEKRGASGPLDLSKITNHVLRDFVESIQKLKDSFSPQVAELVQKRTDTAEELANLNRMKEKSFQEFEQLSSKNAQLADLNNHLVHQIQGLYRANSAEGNNNGSSRANGLGIYPHGKEKPSNSAMEAMKAAGEMTTSISAANMSEEAEPATIVPGPQVVSIRKGQPRKFNWKKGGQNVAKGVTKGLKGAFMSSESGAPQDGMAGMPRSQTQDPSRQGFGFFGNQRKQQVGGKLAQADSVPMLSDAATGLFGTDLEQRMEHEKSIIPAIVTRCIQEVELRGMDMEGIYRKSGAASAIQIIKEGFEKSPQDYDISDPDLDIHAVTSALKQYFRKLPMPLITYDVYEKIIDSGEITSQQTRIDHLRQNLQELPRVHRDVLEFLMFHLRRVVERESENLMTSQNVAVVFAPTIMRPESLAREMTDVQKKNEVLKFLVENCQEVFLGMQG